MRQPKTALGRRRLIILKEITHAHGRPVSIHELSIKANLGPESVRKHLAFLESKKYVLRYDRTKFISLLQNMVAFHGPFLDGETDADSEQ